MMAVGLSKGMLVEWQGRPHVGFGVVSEIGNRRVIVQWDSTDEGSTQFSSDDNSLLRVDLSQGPVSRDSTSELVVIQGALNGTTPPAWDCLIFPDSGGPPRQTNILEADLRPKPAHDPVSRIMSDKIGATNRYLLRQVTSHYLNRHLHDDLVSLGQSQVDIQPHQVSAVHTVTQNYPHRYLLCDETGLGKTIEAGMVIKELRARGAARRVLIICPANLVGQWQFEMRSKFNEEFAVLDGKVVQYLRNSEGYDGNPFAHRDYDSVICSSSWVTRPEWNELCVEAQWDLVVVDEAHHARRYPDGQTTLLFDLVQELVGGQHSRSRGALFLTATPMQLDPLELYGLVELLDPTLFSSEEDFTSHRSRMRGLSDLVERLSDGGIFGADSVPDHAVEEIAGWLGETLNEVRERLASDESGLQNTTRLLSAQHRLSEIMIRNRKAHIGGFMPRSANRWPVNMTVLERNALDAIEDYVNYGYRIAEERQDTVIGFLMVTFQKLAASSHAAILASLNRRKGRLKQAASVAEPWLETSEPEEMLDEDYSSADLAGNSAFSGFSGDSEAEIAFLNRAIRALEALGDTDSKAQAFVTQVRDIFARDEHEKVLVFTQSRETQNLIARLSEARGWGIQLFHGQLSRGEKDEAISQFQRKDGPQILISTEAGAEGRNLQFCRWLVNYDLPWNPMRVEQRIGRLDRIGQTNTVMIGNLFVADSIEERVLDVLEKRIHVFEQTVGGLDEILGGAETDIRRIMALADDRRDKAIEDFAQQHEYRRQQAIKAGGMLGDFIMDTKSFKREIVERITGQKASISRDDLVRFMLRLVQDVGTYVKKIEDNTFSLRFQGQFHDRYRKELFPGSPDVTAVLSRDAFRTVTGDTFLALGHPIIDRIVDLVTADDYEGNAGTRIIQNGSDLAPMEGWVFHYRFTVPGPRPTEELLDVFVSDSGQLSAEIGETLVARAARFDTEGTIQLSENLSNVDGFRSVAEEYAQEHRADIQEKAQSRSRERVDREMRRIQDLYEYRNRVSAGKIAELETRIEESGDLSEGQRRILPVWQARLRGARDAKMADARQRQEMLDDVNKYRNPQVDWSLTAIGRISVVA